MLRHFVLLCLVAGAAACSPSSGGGADAGAENSITGGNPDAGPEGAAADASLPLMTTVRVAQLSRDVGAVDICYRSVLSQTFTGPVFSSPMAPVGDAGSGDAGSGDATRLDGEPDSQTDGAADSEADGTTDGATDSETPAGEAGPDAPPDVIDASSPLVDATAEAGQDATVTDATVRDAADGGPSEEAGTAPDAAPDVTADAAMEAGTSSGLTYLQVSNYVAIMGAGTFEIVVVPGGQGTCTNALIDRMVTLDDGKRGTLAIYGSREVEAGAPSALAMLAMVDDPVAVASSTRTRFFDSAPPDSADAEAESALLVSVVGTPTLELEVVLPGSAPEPSATPPTADALGYHTDVPVAAPARLRLDRYPGAVVDGGLDAGTPVWLGSSVDLRLVAGSIHTGFLVRDTMGDFAVLWCDDTSFGSALSACTLVLR